jgi:hypothetical protein
MIEWSQTKEVRIKATLEPRYLLQNHLGCTLSDTHNMPLWQVRWYINRLSDDFKKANEESGMPPSKAAHLNTPQARALSGKQRHAVPARLRRHK